MKANLLSQLNFTYPDKSDDEKSKIFETSKNNADFLFKLNRNEFKRLYPANSEVYQEAIDALDQMHEKYLKLMAIDKNSSIDLKIDTTGKWFVFVQSIQSMIASITHDEMLMRGVEIEANQAKILSKEISDDFDAKLKENEDHLASTIKKQPQNVVMILGIAIDKKNFPILYRWAKTNPKTLEAQLQSIANAWHEGNIESAAIAFEMDLEHG